MRVGRSDGVNRVNTRGGTRATGWTLQIKLQESRKVHIPSRSGAPERSGEKGRTGDSSADIFSLRRILREKSACERPRGISSAQVCVFRLRNARDARGATATRARVGNPKPAPARVDVCARIAPLAKCPLRIGASIYKADTGWLAGPCNRLPFHFAILQTAGSPFSLSLSLSLSLFLARTASLSDRDSVDCSRRAHNTRPRDILLSFTRPWRHAR